MERTGATGSASGGAPESLPKLVEEERFRLLVEAITDYAVFMLDADGIVTTWNAGARRFKGYAADEIIGQHFSVFYTDEDKAAGLPRRALATAATTGRFEHEGWRVRKDGTRIWVHVLIDPIRNDRGEIIGYAKVTRDLTVRMVAQSELRKSEERFRILVQGIKDYAIFMLDPTGVIANWNSGAQHVKGYAEDEIVGAHFSIFYTPDDHAAGLPDRAIATAEREGRFVGEGWRVRKDGTRFWADVVIDAIRDKDGELIGFAKITRDVTERRNAQIALEEARQKLVQAQKMEMLGQLTGGIAHDFNNLLAVVLGNLDLARRRLDDRDRLLKLIENSIEAGRRGASLTQRMLAFARRQDLRTEPIDVPKLVRDMAALLEGSIGPRIHVVTQFPLTLRPALVDANQLELALLNLVVNARDALPEGGTITIGATEETITAKSAGDLEHGDYIRLSVTDTGEGMDPDTLARAVEPFFTTKGVGAGSGLGLSMVHGFADQSRGRLLLESEIGKGTRAELWLPVAAAATQRPEPKQERVAPIPHTETLSVLIVDDDPLVLSNTAAMLEDLGHEVFEASSGEQALRILHRTKGIDLVVTDQLMPGMLGTDLIANIRLDQPNLPVILATGFAEVSSAAQPDMLRLNKPFMQADLARAIATATRKTSGEGRVLHFRGKV